MKTTVIIFDKAPEENIQDWLDLHPTVELISVIGNVPDGRIVVIYKEVI